MLNWEDFRKEYNIPLYTMGSKYVTDSDITLKQFYYEDGPKLLNEPINKDDFEICQNMLKYYKDALQRNTDSISNRENPYIRYYISWILYNQNPNLSALNSKIKSEDKEFEFALKQHKKYKTLYWIGVIFWMTSCFTIPFILGFFENIITCHHLYGDNIIGASIMMGFAWIGLWSFTMPVTIPISFVIGLLIHPAVLKEIIFSKKHPYCPNLMSTLGHSDTQEDLNTGSVMAGTMLGKYLK